MSRRKKRGRGLKSEEEWKNRKGRTGGGNRKRKAKNRRKQKEVKTGRKGEGKVGIMFK